MKLFLSALCASFIIAPLSFGASAADQKQETIILADCGKCKKDGKKEACPKDCKKDCCKKDGALADCGKCKKDGAKEEPKKESTLAGGKCEKGGCDKDKEEAKKEGTFA